MKQSQVPYRPMPMGYLAIWVGMIGLLMAFRQIQSYGWPPGNYAEFLSSVVIGGLVGGALWGWVFWRFWLYKKFPPPEHAPPNAR